MSTSTTTGATPSPPSNNNNGGNSVFVTNGLDKISKQLAKQGDGWLEKISKQLDGKAGALTGDDPFKGFKIPKLGEIARGLTFGLAPGLIKKSVSGMQTYMDALNSIKVPDLTVSEQLGRVLEGFNDAVSGFANIPWAKAYKGTFLMTLIVNRFKKIGQTLGDAEYMKQLKPFITFARILGPPLQLIGNAFDKFSKIKWSNLYLGAKIFKWTMKNYVEIARLATINYSSFLDLANVLKELSKPLNDFFTAFTKIKWTKIIAANLMFEGIMKTLVKVATFTVANERLFSKFGHVLKTFVDPLKTFAEGFSKIGGALIKASFAMILIGASIIPFAFGLKMLGDINYENLWQGISAIGLITGVLAGLSSIAVPLLIAGSAFAVIGLALIPFALSLKMLSEINYDKFGGLLVAIGSLAGAGVLLSLASPGILAFGLAGIPFAIGMKMLSKIDWAAITVGGAAITSFAEGVNKLKAWSLAGAALSLSAFAVSMTALQISIGKGDRISTFFEKFNKGVNGLNGRSLIDAATGIGNLSISLAAFAGAQVLTGIGNLVSSILSWGSDSPIEQLIKLADHGHNLSILGTGVANLASGLKIMSGITTELDSLETLLDKFDIFTAFDPTGIQAFAGAVNLLCNSLTALKGLGDFKDIPFDKLEALSSSLMSSMPSAIGLNTVLESKSLSPESLRQGIQSPQTGNLLQTYGNSASSPIVIINNNHGGNVVNTSNNSSNVNNNGSTNLNIQTWSGSGMGMFAQ